MSLERIASEDNQYFTIIDNITFQKNHNKYPSRKGIIIIALNAGIPLEVVQKLSGHSMIRTTQIYAKIVNQTVFEQMKKIR